METQLIHIPLNNLSSEKVLDRAGKIAGTAKGATLVPDDAFGACLKFNGKDNYVELEDTVSIAGNASRSFFCWIQFDKDGATRPASIMTMGTAEKAASFNLTKQADSGALAVAGFDYDVYPPAAADSKKLVDGEWHYVGCTYDGSLLKLYIDGKSINEFTRGGYATKRNAYMLGKSNHAGKENFFQGKMAQVRLYSRALGEEEIKTNMQEDKGVYAAFRKSYPIAFALTDKFGQQTLYTGSDKSEHKHLLEITNVSEQPVELGKGESAEAGKNNFHFELKFRKGMLDGQVKVPDKDWTLSQQRNADGTQSIFLLKVSSTLCVLQRGQKLSIPLHNLELALGTGTGTTVELRYDRLRYTGDGDFFSGNRIQYMTISHHEGTKSIPLRAGFINGSLSAEVNAEVFPGNSVLNNGQANTVILKVTNASDKSLPLDTGSNPSHFILSFDASDDTTIDWAIGTGAQVKTFKVAARFGNGSWKEVPLLSQGIGQEWIIENKELSSLEKGQSILVKISNIVTKHADGITNVYLRYANLPGYWDAQLVCPLEKTFVIRSQGNVGVGTLKPAAKAHVVGDLVLGGENKFIIHSRSTNSNPGDFLQITSNNTPQKKWNWEQGITLSRDGKVGIGTTSPRTGLDTGMAVLSGAANDYTKAQFALSGGGVITWSSDGTLGGGRLKWTHPFCTNAVEKGKTFESGGIEIEMPSANLPAAQGYTNSPIPVNVYGIFLRKGDTLYAEHQPGKGRRNVTLRIKNYDHSGEFHAPGNWILIAAVHKEHNTVKLGTGTILQPDSVFPYDYQIPKGTINLWIGNNIPPGWALCDGSDHNGQKTPNLNLFLEPYFNALKVLGQTPAIRVQQGSMPSIKLIIKI